MKQKLIRFSQRYLAALRTYVQHVSLTSLAPATKLGHQAVGFGLETLGLARIHEQASAALGVLKTKNKQIKRAENFFSEANDQIVETYLIARQSKINLSRLMTTLGQRTKELAVSNRQLQHGSAQRKLMADDFEKRGKHHQKCLDESFELQKRLRQLTHQVITTQEDERKKISHELQDEIAQTLLGINVRLLSLKQQARKNTRGLKNEIASTQRLVAKSVKSVREVGRNIGRRPQA